MMRRTLLSLTLVAAAAAFVPTGAGAQAFDDAANAREQMESGSVLSPREVERRIVPDYRRRGYEYLNFEYDSRAHAYRLKFIREGRVTFVDVDARSGRIIRRRR